MKLIFIRHAHPNYALDCLTEKGQREASLLAERVGKWKDIDEIYVSPLNRARLTAEPCLEKLGREAVCLHWLREMAGTVTMPGADRPRICWDFMPDYWTKIPEMYDKENWVNTDIMRSGDAAHEWEYIKLSLDNFLRDHGYRRDGGKYTVEEHNDKTIVIFCHMAVTLFMLAHLLNISPILMAHGFDIPPTGVTMLSTEEREAETAYFRVYTLGDTRHLIEGGEPVSEAGYFGEFFSEL